GIDQEETYLILYPDAPLEKQREILFLRETNEHIAVWEGDKLTKKDGTDFSGIKSVLWNDQFDQTLKHLIGFAEYVYLNMNENDRMETSVPDKDIRLAREMRYKYPLHKYERSAPIMSALRSIKHDIEVATIQKACDITEKGFRRVLDFVKPGVMEYEVEGEIIAEFIRNRATGHAYSPIIASGFDACVLHYVENKKECKDGDLLLMDFGAEYANYASDLTRTIPVNGRFSERQKEVYNACLKVHNEAKNMMCAGETLAEFNAEVRKVMQSALIDIKLIDKNASDEEKTKLTQKHFPHGTSHFMGIDVHDIGNRYGKIEDGMCFTIEPGIYIREENLGVRIENDIIIKSSGNIDLMKNIPITVEEIEDLMN
ncbi:MAG: aminopeptidase P N-terminal domain-containing protein, partial [Chitinophagales bacterium]